ncbi:MAG: hypothetical protein AAGA46_12580 [Cyanobacteria bacterium P01_F01_bin.13]
MISYRQIVRQFLGDAGARYNLGLALWGQGHREAADDNNSGPVGR